MSNATFGFQVHISPFRLRFSLGEKDIDVQPNAEFGNPVAPFLESLTHLLQGEEQNTSVFQGDTRDWEVAFQQSGEQLTLELFSYPHGQKNESNTQLLMTTTGETLELVEKLWRSFRILQSTITEEEWTINWKYTFPEAELDVLMHTLRRAQAQAQI